MREILFRGKRIDNGEWVYGDLVQSPAHGVVQIYEQDLCGDNFSVDPSTIGQYTGLTANGKKIFEGDIVKHFTRVSFGDLSMVEIGKVFWEEYTLQWKRTGKDISREKLETFCMSKDCVYEVIGNIHDNPELLENKP